MTFDQQDYAARYQALSELDLLALARTYESLNGQAQPALRSEFARRGLEPPLLEQPDNQPQARHLVTVRRLRDLSEAIVVRGFLESNGIPVYLQDENLVWLDWQVSNFIGGLRLQVEADDEPSALALLEDPTPGHILFRESPDQSESFAQPHCPVCHSLEIDFQGTGRKAAITSLYLFAIPLPTGPESWLCNHCGARWQADEDDQPA